MLIHWHRLAGEKDYAVIIDPEEALQEILKSNNMRAWYMKFKELNDLYQKMIDEDYEEAEDDAK